MSLPAPVRKGLSGLLFGCLLAGCAAVEPAAAATPVQLQDSQYLNRITSGVTPADGLLSVGVGLRKYSSPYLLSDVPASVDQLDLLLRLEAGPLPWLRVMAQVPWRTWSGGSDWLPASGSGVGDGTWQLTLGSPVVGTWLSAGIGVGGNLPLGSTSAGLGEGVLSPQVTGALTLRLWTDNQTPELRLHLNAAHRWNGAEDAGYGVGTSLFEPWFPKYNAAPAGDETANDYLSLGLGLEFRKGTTTLWFEYWRDDLPHDDSVAACELPSFVTAGLTWGVTEGWALRAAYEVSLAKDDVTTDWYPSYPELVYNFTLCREFSFGGRDRDGDGVVDRKDTCPDSPEDLDGFEDEDGCPDEDNDGDGIPDRYDGAPNQPEDFDGWQDEDGIPELDNDGDGIPDRYDLCPNEAEDFDGMADDDGCPDDFVDRDADGIADEQDQCPDDPEDLDGFEDGDGCPEADNDMDGIDDVNDACPDEPEDYDGDADEDGCPDSVPDPDQSVPSPEGD